MAQRQKQIKIIAVSQPAHTANANGGYNAIEVTYKTADGKTEGKKLVDFNTQERPHNKEVYNAARTLKEGDQVVVTEEKGEKFWNWVEVSLAGATTPNSATQPSETVNVPVDNAGGDSGAKASASTRGRVAGSNYETPEERAMRREFEKVKHRQIGRQGCINSAISILAASGAPFDTGNVVEKAKELEQFVFSSTTDIPF